MAAHGVHAGLEWPHMACALQGFNGRILAYDVRQSPKAVELGAEYTDLETLLRESDFVSLHVPLLPSTFHLINAERCGRSS